MLPALLISALLAQPASAIVLYGDFASTDVQFTNVREDVTSPGDSAVQWGAPSVAPNNTLSISPTAFAAVAANGSSDTAGSVFVTTIFAQPGETLSAINMLWGGTSTMTSFPPFGTPETNTMASLSGYVVISQDTGGGIAPVFFSFATQYADGSSFSLPAEFGTNSWSASASIDLAVLAPNATRAELVIVGELSAQTNQGNTSAAIELSSSSIEVVAGSTPMPIPTPAPLLLIALALPALRFRVKNRGRVGRGVV